MKVLYASDWTPEMLLYSNVPEPGPFDPDEWDPEHCYAAGDRCCRLTTHKVYESVGDGNTGKVPEDNVTGSPPLWFEVGMTNRHRMFDENLKSCTEVAGELVVEIDATRTTAVALIGILAENVEISMVDPDGDVVATVEMDLLRTDNVFDFYSYIYSDFLYYGKVFWTYPGYLTSGNRLRIKMMPLDGRVEARTVFRGREIYIGETKRKVSLGFNDFSKVEEDSFGGWYIERGDYRDISTFTVEIDNEKSSLLHQTLTWLRAKKCVWIVDNTETFDGVEGVEPEDGSSERVMQALIIYGLLRHYEMTIDSTAPGITNSIDLQLEGLPQS